MTEIQQVVSTIPIPVNGEIEERGGTLNSLMLNWLMPPGADIPPYWSRSRDIHLRDFWIDNVSLKPAVTTFVNKASAIPFAVHPNDRSIGRHVRQAKRIENSLRRNSGMLNVGPMRGFKKAFKSFITDVLTQDNGGFFLIMGRGRADGPIVGMATGLIHLDSALCTRTSDPEYPAVYYHKDGSKYKIHHSRLIEIAHLPSPVSQLNGVGLCPISCCYEAARELWDIYRYSSEKFGSRPPRQILYAESGATIEALQNAITHWELKMDQKNQSRFGSTLVIAPNVPTGQLKLQLVDLSRTPDGFDRKDVMMQDKAEIAAAFGLDLLDLAMSFGLQGQTRANAGVQDRKGRGKGVGELLETFVDLMNEFYLPSHMTMRFDNLDDDQDEQRSQIRDTRSQARQRDLESGVTNVRVERERMWAEGEISQEQFEDMELEDGRLPNGLPILLLFRSEDSNFQQWLDLGMEDPTNIEENDPEAMIDLIHDQLLVVATVVNETTDVITRRKALQALAALRYLQEQYEEKKEQDKLEEQMEEAQETEAIVSESNESSSQTDTSTISGESTETEE